MTVQTATAVAPDETRRSAGTVVLVSAAFLMVTLDALVVVTALPSIQESLGGRPDGLQWIVNAYNLTFAAGIVAGAAFGDRFGRKRVFLAGLAVFTIASAACALAPALGLLVACRAVQGLGGAIVTPVGLTLITESFPASRRGAAIGLWGGVSGLGAAAGPLVGGAVTQGLDWHWIFWVNVPLGTAALVGCARLLRESLGALRTVDLPGMALIGAALLLIVDGLVEAPTQGWASTRTVAVLALGASLLVAFLLRERYADQPMVPLPLFRHRVFRAAVGANLLSTAALFSAAYIMSQFFQLGLGYSPLVTGLRFLPWTVTPLLIAPLAGVWCDRVGARKVAVPGLVLQAIGFLTIVVLAHESQPWAAYVVPLVIAGVGASLALPSLPAAALSAVPTEEIGMAAGVLNTSQRVGSVIGIAVITAVFDAKGSLASASSVTHGFLWALAFSAIFSTLGAAAAVRIGRRTAPVPGPAPVRG